MSAPCWGWPGPTKGGHRSISRQDGLALTAEQVWVYSVNAVALAISIEKSPVCIIADVGERSRTPDDRATDGREPTVDATLHVSGER